MTMESTTTLTFAEYEDRYLQFIHKWNSDSEINPKLGYEKIPIIEETAKVIKDLFADDRQVLFMILYKGQPIGYFKLSNMALNYGVADLHTVIGEKKYIGTHVCVEAMNNILDYCFNALGLHRVTTYIMGNNPKLIRTAKNYGWTEEGIMKEVIKLHNQRIDYHMFRMLKSEFRRY